MWAKLGPVIEIEWEIAEGHYRHNSQAGIEPWWVRRAVAITRKKEHLVLHRKKKLPYELYRSAPATYFGGKKE